MERVIPAIVRVETEFGWGSGVVIRSDGYILTAHQVVENAAIIQVRLLNGPIIPAKLEGIDLGPGYRLALVGRSGSDNAALPRK